MKERIEEINDTNIQDTSLDHMRAALHNPLFPRPKSHATRDALMQELERLDSSEGEMYLGLLQEIADSMTAWRPEIPVVMRTAPFYRSVLEGYKRCVKNGNEYFASKYHRLLEFMFRYRA